MLAYQGTSLANSHPHTWGLRNHCSERHVMKNSRDTPIIKFYHIGSEQSEPFVCAWRFVFWECISLKLKYKLSLKDIQRDFISEYTYKKRDDGLKYELNHQVIFTELRCDNVWFTITLVWYFTNRQYTKHRFIMCVP